MTSTAIDHRRRTTRGTAASRPSNVATTVVVNLVKVLVGRKDARLDNSYVHNLIHGFILAAEHLAPGGTAPGQAYFINDDEPVNMFEFTRPVIAACGVSPGVKKP